MTERRTDSAGATARLGGLTSVHLLGHLDILRRPLFPLLPDLRTIGSTVSAKVQIPEEAKAGRGLACLRIWFRAVFSRSIALFLRSVCLAFFRFENPVRYSLSKPARGQSVVYTVMMDGKEGEGRTFGRRRQRRPP